ncbi:DedA family protein [Desulfovibrio aminophilus]|uniref:DedA family protein n=1 Tax=Desulfovibrio aminophilus TaxID=81425 RepID=UPI003397823E
MDILLQYMDFILHVDRHLGGLFEHYGTWIYFILAGIVFCETGLVVTPFLPGDSLLFAVGALAGAGLIDPWLAFFLLMTAAICGDNVNYWLGRKVGPAVFVRETSRLLNKKHLFHAQAFYEHHGGKTIIIARFVPIVRTFAPFVAGIGRMNYRRFLSYSLAGGMLWTGSFIALGVFFGNLPVVRENFGLAVIAIIIISVMPAVIEILRARRRQRKA